MKKHRTVDAEKWNIERSEKSKQREPFGFFFTKVIFRRCIFSIKTFCEKSLL